MTSKPSWARRRAMAAPMPLLAPVTSAVGIRRSERLQRKSLRLLSSRRRSPERERTGGREDAGQEADDGAAVEQRQPCLRLALEDVAHEDGVADERADG